MFLYLDDPADPNLPVHKDLSKYYDSYAGDCYGLLRKLCYDDHEMIEMLLKGLFVKLNTSLHHGTASDETIFLRILRITIRHLRDHGIDPLPAIKKMME